MVFLVTFVCYGSHLPGDPRGSSDHVRRGHRRFFPPKPGLENYCRRAMNEPAYLLESPESREAVRTAIVDVCGFRRWFLYALHVRTNHVHGVVRADANPSRVLNDWKAYATRSLRLSGSVAPGRRIWAGSGNIAVIKSSAVLASAIRYVLEKQGEPMATYCADERF